MAADRSIGWNVRGHSNKDFIVKWELLKTVTLIADKAAVNGL